MNVTLVSSFTFALPPALIVTSHFPFLHTLSGSNLSGNHWFFSLACSLSALTIARLSVPSPASCCSIVCFYDHWTWPWFSSGPTLSASALWMIECCSDCLVFSVLALAMWTPSPCSLPLCSWYSWYIRRRTGLWLELKNGGSRNWIYFVYDHYCLVCTEIITFCHFTIVSLFIALGCLFLFLDSFPISPRLVLCPNSLRL